MMRNTKERGEGAVETLPRRENRNSDSLEMVSFLATMLVVICHVDDFMNLGTGVAASLVEYLGGAFSDANVANFFVLSGYFLARHAREKSWYRDAVKKRIRTLVAPYLIWCSLYFLVFGLLNVLYPGFSPCPSFEILRTPLKALAGIYGAAPLGVPCLFPFWYIKFLLILVITSPFLFLFVRCGRMVVCSLVVVLLTCDIFICQWLGVGDFIRKFIICPIGLACFLVGAEFAFRPLELKWNRAMGFLGIALWLVSSGICFFLPVIWSHYLTPINICVEVLCLQLIVRSFRLRLPSVLVGTTFLIYVFHWPLLQVLTVNGFHASGYFAFLEFTALLVIVVLLSIVGAKILTRIVPQFTAVATGGRF